MTLTEYIKISYDSLKKEGIKGFNVPKEQFCTHEHINKMVQNMKTLETLQDIAFQLESKQITEIGDVDLTDFLNQKQKEEIETIFK